MGILKKFVKGMVYALLLVCGLALFVLVITYFTEDREAFQEVQHFILGPVFWSVGALFALINGVIALFKRDNSGEKTAPDDDRDDS